MRKDIVFVSLVLIVSAIFSYFKGYIDTGIGLIMTTAGGYIGAIGLFLKKNQPKNQLKKTAYLINYPNNKLNI